MFAVSVSYRKPLPRCDSSRNDIPGKNFLVEGLDTGRRKDFPHYSPLSRKSFPVPVRSWGRRFAPSDWQETNSLPETLSQSPFPLSGARTKFREGFSRSGRCWKDVPHSGYLPRHASGNTEPFSPCGKLVPSSQPSTTDGKSFPGDALGPSARSEKRTDP